MWARAGWMDGWMDEWMGGGTVALLLLLIVRPTSDEVFCGIFHRFIYRSSSFV